MGLRGGLPGPAELARIREKAKRYWARAGALKSNPGGIRNRIPGQKHREKTKEKGDAEAC